MSDYISNIKDSIINTLQSWFFTLIDVYLPKIIGALLIIWLWVIVSILTYRAVMYMFNKFKIIELIDNIFISMKKQELTENKENNKNWKQNKVAQKIEKISDQIKIDAIFSKAISYYLFLIFFRYSIVFIWIREIEIFLAELIAYLPNLFIWIIIGFFGIRFANFIYDIVFHALDLTKQKTAKIVASGAKIIILFFTLMMVLSKIWIATTITNTILIGFISMLALAWGLAFWLGWKDIASEILESFRK